VRPFPDPAHPFSIQTEGERPLELSLHSVCLISLSGMRDADVRRVLRDQLTATHGADEGTLLVEELGLCRGSVRADLAVVNGILKGYEIKSERDTLARLGSQASVYSQVFDTVTLVVADRHLAAAEMLVPPWWGIVVASCQETSYVKLTVFREEVLNADVNAHVLVQLLWRDEVLALLGDLIPLKSFRSKPRSHLWQCLADAASLSTLKDAVRECLKSRIGWRVDALQMRDGETFPLSAMSSDCQVRLGGTRTRRYTHRPC
jgi:hypothetical protein